LCASARKSRQLGFGNSFLRQFSALRKTIGDGRPGTVCHLRRQKNPPPSIIHHQPSIINLSFPDSCPLRRRQSVTVVRGRCVTFGDGKIIHHQPSIINLSFPDSCPLRRRQSVTAVRGRCVTFGDGKIFHHPSSTINHQSLFPRQLPAPQATIGEGRSGTMCHLRRRKNPPPSTIHHQSSIINHPSSTINFSILFPIFVTI